MSKRIAFSIAYWIIVLQVSVVLSYCAAMYFAIGPAVERRENAYAIVAGEGTPGFNTFVNGTDEGIEIPSQQVAPPEQTFLATVNITAEINMPNAPVGQACQINASGSGVVVDKVGNRALVLTCAHTFDEDVTKRPFDTVRCQFAKGEKYLVERVEIDPSGSDLAVFEVECPAYVQPVKVADREPQRGELITTLGYGGDKGLAYSNGRFSAMGWVEDTKEPCLNVIGVARQGDSGGPIVNQNQYLCGIITGGGRGEGGKPYASGPCVGPIRRLLGNRVPAFRQRWGSRGAGLAPGRQPADNRPTTGRQPQSRLVDPGPDPFQPQVVPIQPQAGNSGNSGDGWRPGKVLGRILPQPASPGDAVGRTTGIEGAVKAAVMSTTTKWLVAAGIASPIATVAAWGLYRVGRRVINRRKEKAKQVLAEKVREIVGRLHPDKQPSPELSPTSQGAGLAPAEPAPAATSQPVDLDEGPLAARQGAIRVNRYIEFDGRKTDKAWADAHAILIEKYPGMRQALERAQRLKEHLMKGYPLEGFNV